MNLRRTTCNKEEAVLNPHCANGVIRVHIAPRFVASVVRSLTQHGTPELLSMYSGNTFASEVVCCGS